MKNDHIDPLFQQILNLILPAALQTPKGTAKLAADLDIVGEADALAAELREEPEPFDELTGPMDTRRTGVQWWETSGQGGAQ